MFQKQINKIKGWMQKDEGKNQKKKIENLIFFLVLLVVTIVAINLIWKEDKTEEKEQENSNTVGSKTLADTSSENTISTSDVTNLDSNLEGILSQIDGVGKVSVLVTYSESSQSVAMYNENTKETSTEEKDESGGTRTITESDTQKDVIFKETDGEKEPVIQKTVMPKIEGAIVTAEGAGNANVKATIVQAVEAVTGLATHKIQVFEMKK